MERTISMEERIRRAEEIYNRRRMQTGSIRISNSNTKNKEKTRIGLLKRMILQILICLFIYLILYTIKNSNYIFSDEVINKTRQFLSYDVNITEYYNNTIKPWFENQNFNFLNWNKVEDLKDDILNEQKEDNEDEETDTLDGNTINKQEDNLLTNNENNLGIGGGESVETSADEQQNNSEDINAEPVKQLSQMEIDANEIKANYSFVLPLSGTVSSRFGPRTPTQIISANHAGIDIAANEGTKFVCAMEGTITYVSSYGSYGNHVYIENGDVLTIYAHCKTIYVKQGDTIKQGDIIGEVGQTGNATGPHLHFEIRKSDRVVNPEYIMSF